MTIWDDDSRCYITVTSHVFTGPQATMSLIHRDWQLCYQVQNTLVNAAPGAGDWIKPDDVRGIETANGSIWQTSVVTPNSGPVKPERIVPNPPACVTCGARARRWLTSSHPRCQSCQEIIQHGKTERRKKPREGKAA